MFGDVYGISIELKIKNYKTTCRFYRTEPMVVCLWFTVINRLFIPFFV